jgi:branched-chain amino acid transport system ATP-binding protein
MSAPLLQVDGLSAGYDQTEVVRDVSLEVREGQYVGLIGPNGHGKTTLLRAIMGLQKPWTGRVRFAGEDVAGEATHRLARAGLVHVPQGDLLFGDMTVRDNLLAAAQGDRWARRGELLRSVHEVFPILDERRDQLAGTMSGGQRRMLAIARGLMMQPRLLVLDEPSLGLAPKVVADVYVNLEGLVRQNVTVLIVEENPQRLRTLATHVYLLEAGRIMRHGSLDEVLRDEQLLKTYLGTGAAPATA